VNGAPLVLIPQGPPDINIPPEAIRAAIQVGQYFLAGCVILGVGSPLFRWILRRFFEAAPVLPPAQLAPEASARLERIEQAVEAVAIEVERIAEAQRFSAKLLAEQQKRSLASPSSQSPA
jgi:hypothetical protein